MSEWKEYRLGDIVEILDSKRIPLSATQRQSMKGCYRYFGAQGIIDYINDYIFDGEYLILAEDGENLKSRKAPIARIVSGKFWLNNHAHIMQSNGKANLKLLNAILNKSDISGYITGSAQPKLNQENMSCIKVKLPSLHEQKKIAGILSSLDEKIETNRKINARLEELAQAIFKSWFIDFEPFGGKKPEDWVYKAISDFPHEIETGKRPKGGVSGITEGIPSIGAESIKGIGYYDYAKTKYIPYEFAESMKKGRIKDFDLLIYKDGGKPGYFIPDFSMMGMGFPFDEMFLNEHVFRLNFGKPELNIFAYFFFKTEEIMNYLNSVGGKAAIPGINQKNVEDVEILDLDIPQIHKFGKIVLPMFQDILENSKESARLAALRDTLLPKLMSGELIPE